MSKKQPPKAIVRDISWLSFNERVLQESKDQNNQLYDRLRFLGIYSNNQDEFFRVRVAALNRMLALNKSTKMHLEENPEKILKQIHEIVIKQSSDFDKIYAEIIKELEQKGIFIKNEKALNAAQQMFIKQYFDEQVRTLIVPLMIESIPEMPLLNDKSIYLACILGNSADATLQRYALIEIPTKLTPRFVVLPSAESVVDIILLEDVIRYNLPNIFAAFGYNRFLGYLIKVTKDAELDLDNDVNANVIEDLKKSIKNRKKGKTTRFVYDKNINPNLLEFILKRFSISKKDNLIPGGRIHNFKDFINFPASAFKELQPLPSPFVHPLLKQPCKIMDVMDKQDIMLNFPYHGFDSIIDLLREAAIDPFVQTIKITCYRLAKNSKIVNALLNAVRNGKVVTVALELRARFDEEANLEWKTKLEDEGVKVLLGIPNQKMHAKLCLITKKEFDKNKDYVFISTGNFNEGTANYYGDHCLFTTNKNIIADVKRIFNYLENPHKKANQLHHCKTLLVAPTNMRSELLRHMDNVIDSAKKGEKALIIIKCNSLVDKELVDKLYSAARMGAEVKLIIRGICCVLPLQKDFKHPIYAISIVDNYLEHARVFLFQYGKHTKVFISSADLMVRNLDHRVEAATPVFDEDLIRELQEILNIQLKGNVKSRILDNKQVNDYVLAKENETTVRAQLEIYKYLVNKEYIVK